MYNINYPASAPLADANAPIYYASAVVAGTPVNIRDISEAQVELALRESLLGIGSTTPAEVEASRIRLTAICQEHANAYLAGAGAAAPLAPGIPAGAEAIAFAGIQAQLQAMNIQNQQNQQNLNNHASGYFE